MMIKRQHSELSWTSFVDAVVDDDGAAANEHLDAGRAIYYIEDVTPKGFLVKEHPSGRRELVRFNPEGDDVISIL